MEKPNSELILLIDKALSACERCIVESEIKSEAWSLELCRKAILNFKDIRSAAEHGNLPPSKGGGLGISRSLGEWAPVYLVEAGSAVDDFYRHNFS